MRILIGLIEHMGDIVACEPVSRYLKECFSAAELTWAVSPAYRELIDTNPNIDRTLVLDCLTDWIRLTKHGSYDKIVDLHVNYRICQHCGIPLVKKTSNPFINVYEWFDYGTLQEAFTLGAGLPALSDQPQLYLQPEHKKAVDALGLPAAFCVMHRESNSESKDWNDEGWCALSEWIRTDLKLPIVEVGAGRARSPSSLSFGVIDLVNKITILQTAEVIRRSRFFIGVDSGPAHLANALQVPGVVLLGRLSYFRQYMPFNGFFASGSPLVKMVRNLTGPVSALRVDEVLEAARYVAAACASPKTPACHDLSGTLRRKDKPKRSPSHNEDRKLVLESGLFDARWYKRKYPDVNDMDPLDHFLVFGSAAKLSPGPEFDSESYLRKYADVANDQVNPLLHYIRFGQKEGRECFTHKSVQTMISEDRERVSMVDSADGPIVLEQTREAVLAPSVAAGSDSKCPRTFAFYLPQFYPIAENDWAHGPGFTEWHKIIRAEPLFRGHYQPRVPGELGFYDLRSADVLRQQVDLARSHGVSGFCFYYYYFQGKRILYQPISNYIHSKLDAPFFLLWANENWTKRWDGGDSEVIIEQRHSKEDDLAFIRELLPLFEDRRYVKVDGKPLLLIYKPHLFPEILPTTEIWREEVEKAGFPGLYLVMADDWFMAEYHPRQYGFDAAYEIPSNLVPQEVLRTDLDSLELKEGFQGRIVDYPKFASFHLARPFPEYKRFRTVMLPWDNSPRYGSRAMVHVDGGGDAYRVWLMQALLDTYRRYPPDERIVFLHSWNEWCEGTYLEPDGKFGRKFLQQTSDATRLVRQAIDLTDGSPDSVEVMSELLRVMEAKDEGAFRILRASRSEAGFLSREVERLKKSEEIARSELNTLYDSRSWRITKPLRVLIAQLRGRS